MEGDSMNTEDIISMAREAGYDHQPTVRLAYQGFDLQRFYELATTREREARQAAQIENEELKARLARADLEQQRAVMAEREACAKVCDNLTSEWTPEECAAAIRARKDNT
jgi:hypothetical protein